MPVMQKFFCSLLIVCSVAIIASQIAAQTEQRSVVPSAQVHAVREKCIAKAQAEYPDSGTHEFLQERTYSYEACMTNAGLRP